MTLGVTHAALFTHPPAIHTEDLWEATDPFNPALSPPRPAKWRPLSPLSAPGHSPRSAAAVSRGTPGPPCRHRGGVAGTRAQPRVVAPLRGPPILPPSWGSPRTRALLPVPGARRKASRAPASRRGAGGDRQEATAKGKEEWGGEGEAESDSMGGHLIPSAAGWPQSRPPPPAVGGYSDRARPRQVSGRPALLTPATPPLPRPVGSGMPGLGLLKPSTPATGRAWVSKKERL